MFYGKIFISVNDDKNENSNKNLDGFGWECVKIIHSQLEVWEWVKQLEKRMEISGETFNTLST